MRLWLLLLLSASPSMAAEGPYTPRVDLDAGRYLKAMTEAEARIRQNPHDALAWAAKSQALTAQLRFSEGLAAAGQSLGLKNDLADGLLARGLARAGKAVQQRNLGSVRGVSNAMDDFRAATEADPSLVGAWMSLGLAYEQVPGFFGGSTKQAFRCADSLRRVNPSRGDLLQGLVLAMEERWTEALPFFVRALSAAPGDPEIVYGYLDALGSRATRKSLGEEGQRRMCVVEAYRLLPAMKGRARGLQAICDALLDGGDPEGAWKVAKESVARADSPSIMRAQLGKVAARAGIHREDGLAFLDQVLKEPFEGGTGGLPSIHWRRGQILKDLGRKDEARAAAQAALGIDPKHPGARRLLDDLG